MDRLPSDIAQTRYMNRPRMPTSQTRYRDRHCKPMYYFGSRGNVNGGNTVLRTVPFLCRILPYRFKQVLHCSTTSDEN